MRKSGTARFDCGGGLRRDWEPESEDSATVRLVPATNVTLMILNHAIGCA